VLIAQRADNVAMAMIFVLGFLLLAGVLSVVSGDTRDLDVNDRRGWWPGRR
jgi:hypothetical protein